MAGPQAGLRNSPPEEEEGEKEKEDRKEEEEEEEEEEDQEEEDQEEVSPPAMFAAAGAECSGRALQFARGAAPAGVNERRNIYHGSRGGQGGTADWSAASSSFSS